MEEREGRVGERADRHDGRHAQVATERARHVGTHDRRHAQQRHRHVGRPARRGRDVFDLGERLTERRGRVARHVFVGHGGASATTSVHLDAGPDDDRAQRRALGRRAEHRDGAGARALGGAARTGPRVRLVDAEMHDDVGIERPDERDAAGAITRVDAMEFGAPQPSARRIDVEPGDLADVAVRSRAAGRRGCRARRPCP